MPQQLQQVPKLAVNVAAYRYRSRDGLDIGFLHEDGTNSVTENLHFGLGKVLARE